MIRQQQEDMGLLPASDLLKSNLTRKSKLIDEMSWDNI
jgi:hypothetical protein